MTTNTRTESHPATYTKKLSFSATTLSALYMVPLATQAAVVNVTAPLTISIEDARAFDYQPVDWDVDGNSVADFRLEAFRTISYIGTSTTYGGYSSSRPLGSLQLNSVGLGGQGMVQNTGDNPVDIQNLSAGSTVGPTLAAGRQWGAQANRIMMTSSSYLGFSTSNQFGSDNLIGFRFLGNGGQTLYGWAELSLDESFLTMTIDQWAYEDSGGNIDVGTVPLPPAFFTMLSGLALGAGGVIRGRRQRKAAQDADTHNS